MPKISDQPAGFLPNSSRTERPPSVTVWYRPPTEVTVASAGTATSGRTPSRSAATIASAALAWLA